MAARWWVIWLWNTKRDEWVGVDVTQDREGQLKHWRNYGGPEAVFAARQVGAPRDRPLRPILLRTLTDVPMTVRNVADRVERGVQNIHHELRSMQKDGLVVCETGHRYRLASQEERGTP